MTGNHKLEHTNTLQPASLDIWDKKYRLKEKDGIPIDSSIKDTHIRVARALADVETSQTNKDHWYKEFLWALNHGAIPAGRIMSNAGAGDYKPATSLVNCTVSGNINDSMDDILSKAHESGITLASGAGIGYSFSTLRPKGAHIAGAGAQTGGALSFMDIYDSMCFTISSAGGRRGAQMATFDVSHPDVLEFIKAKREDGRLRQFNMSLLITEDFIQAVKKYENWDLTFPMTLKEAADYDLTDTSKVVFKPWPITDNYVVDDQGRVACRIYKTIRSHQLWEAIMGATYNYAEPGFILIDKVNEMNNNWWCEEITSTNPCGEQPLPPYGSCLLGSINLTKFVLDPFTPKARFDWDTYRKVIAIFTRMLDNVVERNGLPLSQQRDEIFDKRRHGMGFLGLGSTMTMLTMTYGSEESIEFTENVTEQLVLVGWRTGIDIAQEKGPAPILNRRFTLDASMLAKRPEMLKGGYLLNDNVSGKELFRYSRYMQQLEVSYPDLVANICAYGSRFTHHSSIAPTGTIALSLANNASNGIEPSFAHHYSRNVIREGKKTKEKVEVFSYELLLYRELINPNAMPFSEKEDEKLPDYFISSDSISPKAHVDVQAAAQTWVDSSISKTINVPTDFPYSDFRDIYMYAYDKGLKGCTTFRFNPEVFQGVLVNEKDLENTTYSFTLDDGSVVDLKGNDEIKYDGDTHTAANLYDALKEGTYGKY